MKSKKVLQYYFKLDIFLYLNDFYATVIEMILN